MRCHLTQPADRLDQYDCAYNLFRNRRRPEILCATPEDRPVPGFLEGKVWRFERKLRCGTEAPGGFDEQAARVGVRYNGFHLFQAIGPDAAGSDDLSPECVEERISYLERRNGEVKAALAALKAKRAEMTRARPVLAA
jgi:hypothetical protein